MTNPIIVVVFTVAVFIAIRSSVKRFSGKGGCCGGTPSCKPEPKQLLQVIDRKTLHISGLCCESCANRVMESLQRIEGVSAIVSLKHSLAEVSMDRAIQNSALVEAVQKAGFAVAAID